MWRLDIRPPRGLRFSMPAVGASAGRRRFVRSEPTRWEIACRISRPRRRTCARPAQPRAQSGPAGGPAHGAQESQDDRLRAGRAADGRAAAGSRGAQRPDPQELRRPPQEPAGHGAVDAHRTLVWKTKGRSRTLRARPFASRRGIRSVPGASQAGLRPESHRRELASAALAVPLGRIVHVAALGALERLDLLRQERRAGRSARVRQTGLPPGAPRRIALACSAVWRDSPTTGKSGGVTAGRARAQRDGAAAAVATGSRRGVRPLRRSGRPRLGYGALRRGGRRVVLGLHHRMQERQLVERFRAAQQPRPRCHAVPAARVSARRPLRRTSDSPAPRWVRSRCRPAGGMWRSPC